MYIKRFFKDLSKYKKYVVCATKANLKTEVTGSYLAWLWWVLEPFCFMLIYTFISDVVFKKSMPFASIFVFLGLTVWNFFDKNVESSVKLLKANRGIITKIYLPKYLIYIRQMMVNGFKMVISLALSVVLMIFYQVPVDWHVFGLIPCFIMLLFVTFGMGCILMHLGVYIEDLAQVVRIGMRLVFYLSGVFYDITKSISKPYGELLVNINPVALAMESARNSLLYKTSPDWVMLGIWTAIGIVLSVIGIVVVYKNENNYGKIL